jgi:SAM-dependent methyltransferase
MATAAYVGVVQRNKEWIMNQHARPAAAFDADQAEEFLDKVSGILDSGALAVMISIGHKSGLFGTMGSMAPSTSAEIAAEAGLSERYVREWLAAMVTGGIVTYDPPTRQYQLPGEHAASLTPGASLGNMAVYAQAVALAGSMQDRLLKCLRTGEGIGYEDYPCFHQMMAEDSGQTVVAGIEDILGTLAREIVTDLEAGIDVLDAGCGAGLAAIRMAELFPNSRFTGYDLCEDAIAMARTEAAARGVGNVRFEVRDLTGLDAKEAFDLVTSFDAVHDMKHPQRLLETIHGALRSGGTHLMQDIGGSAVLEQNVGFPFASFLYTISFMHCMPVSLAQGGDGLGTMWGWETAERMLEAAGFRSVTRTVLPHDPMNVWFVSRKA